MFNRRTLFILGAGASCEFDLPLGPELAKRIAGKASVRYEHARISDAGDPDLSGSFLRRNPTDVGEMLKACLLIQHGVQLSSSIDDFLDVHADNPHVQRFGKMAIVKTILEAERSSKLYFDKSNAYNRMSVANFEGSWIVKFMRGLGRGVSFADRRNLFKNVAFIVFNYDRCLEHFLFQAIRQLYFIEESEALEILGTLTIVHPYGAAAPFPTLKDKGVPYGGDYDGLRADYFQLSDGIRTYTEQMTDKGELAKIYTEMNAADRIVFLGFAFHDQNMNLLRPKGGLSKLVQMFATARGMSDSDVEVARSQMLHLYSDKTMRNARSSNKGREIRSDLTCASFFDFYSKSLPA